MSATSRKNKKNKKNKKPVVSNACAHIAEENANIVAEALHQVGIKTTISSYQPWWCQDAKYKGEVTELIINDILDGEGEQYTIMFKHSDGRPILNNNSY